jgi:hypothetical protein
MSGAPSKGRDGVDAGGRRAVSELGGRSGGERRKNTRRHGGGARLLLSTDTIASIDSTVQWWVQRSCGARSSLSKGCEAVDGVAAGTLLLACVRLLDDAGW